MRHQLFETGKPHSHDFEFYKEIPTADHINQVDGGHRFRLLKTLEHLTEIIQPTDTVCDFGCGNGGLIREIEQVHTNTIWGYDLMPSNVQDAKSKGNENIILHDFVTDAENIVKYPNIAICTEVLEHLENPDAFLIRLRENGVRAVLASSPNYETPTYHAPGHLWVFNGDTYKDMFVDAGWTIKLFWKDFFQYVIAVNE
jgi:2-polyprenyl-3-methyl-5-hydroxy-6-metoxy-1,4-benzoquinol methylase